METIFTLIRQLIKSLAGAVHDGEHSGVTTWRTRRKARAGGAMCRFESGPPLNHFITFLKEAVTL
jgi:hypothetical protein